MPVYNKRGILLLPKVIVLNPKDGSLVHNIPICYTGVSADNTGIAYVMGLFLSLQNFMMLGSKNFLTPLIPNCYVLCTPAILLFKN